ncbi:hypothetical protein PFFCH_00631 [Plasmodium falciparum FCH/4]|uniref:Erythrocyte membrane protein 1 n=1 Tax=Plasmodium falciparum FCH/4 TaxID=1036724 RepID=A0A024VTC6_PLAFA|nr:hypothetical protein PFFCH_00631 [Plasmodium falciparum FCH/4]
MAPQGGSGGSTQDEDAKNMFDRIGKDVYDLVKKDANDFGDELKGKLQEAKGMGELVSSPNPCELVKEYYERVNKGGDSDKRHPCGTGKDAKNEDVNRFSDKQGAECTKNTIKDSVTNSVGACAPYRRLHVCDKNMVKMDTNNDDSSKAKNDLLAEVCMAAKYEGASITLHYPQYQNKYDDSGSTMCTMLARSFADIGDIKIYNELTSTRGKTNGEAAKEYYQDKNGGNYFQLREDWWTANRHTVWKAITCSDDLKGASYFRPTCIDGKSQSQANKYCRCGNDQPGQDKPNIDPPTYFDYVPQFLRWFEEWTEDFCRKRKHKLVDAIKKCRGEDGSGEKRYCDLNGYDCKGTFSAKKKYRWDHKCTGCFLSCSHFRTWIDNQKEQFDKQRNKYDKEIKKYTNGGGGGGGRRLRRSAHGGSNVNGYEKIFYDKLKNDGYQTVDKFLDLLSKEDVCKKITEKEGGTIHFEKVNSDSTGGDGDGSNKTFSHTEYCQACPLCGVERNGKEWERKDSMDKCPPIKLYKPKGDDVGTPINFLYSGDEATEIAEKLKKFCTKTQSATGSGNGVVASVASGDKNGGSDSQDLYQKWTCYQFEDLQKDGQDVVEDEVYDQEVKDAGGLCILKKEKKTDNDPADIQKTFNDFFYYWVVHMLKDSIHWRTEKLVKCLKNEKEKCGNKKCKGDCDCFKNWIGKKKTEWTNIKEHFGKQEVFKNKGDMGNDTFLGEAMRSPDVVLDGVLEKGVLLTSIKEAYGNEKDIDHIKKLLDEEKQKNQAEEAAGTDNKNKTTIDKLLKHELKEAEDCLKKQEECKEQEEATRARARADSPSAPSPPPEEEEDEEDDEDDVSHVGDEETEETKVVDQVEGEGEPEVSKPEQVPEQPESQPESQPEPTEESNETTDRGELQEEEEEGEAPQPQDHNKTEPQADENEPSVPEQTNEEDRAPPPAAPPKEKTQSKKRPKPKITLNEYKLNDVLLPSAFPLSVGIAFAALSYFVLKKKTKSTIDLFRVINIPKGNYGIPTLKSKNRYIPYKSAQYKGKTYIYMEGDSSGDEKYAFMSDTTDVTSSESEYEEIDINDIYVPGSPKYKTLIEVVLEPSGNNTTASGKNTTASGNNTTASGKNTPSDTQNDIQNDGIPSNKFSDNEWNTLKHDFISQYLQSEQPNDVPNDYKNGNIPFNTQPNTLYFDNNQEKPFITSIHDRNLYNGEEYSYNVNMVNSMDDIPINRDNNDVYSGIDLINDSLNNNKVDIYDEVLKRKENELFGTNHPKHTNTHNVTKSSNSDPIDNQLDLFHKWLDRHRDMCEQWNNKEEVLDKLKEEWNKDNNKHNGENTINKTLNTDVSIHIHMDDPKPTNEFIFMSFIYLYRSL